MPPATEPFWTGLLDVPLDAYVDDPLVGAVLVPDTDLPRLGAGPDRPVSVVLTGGAGQVAGPAAYCGRAGLRLAGLTVALRDLDDLAGNARRVVAAVDAARGEGALDEDTPVYVELPAAASSSGPSYGWLAAADEAAGAELRLGLRPGDVPSATLAAWIDAALDRETPFRTAAGGPGVLQILLATTRAFDGAPADQVAAVLDCAVDAGTGLDELARGRRWLTAAAADDLHQPLADLRALGLR